MKPSSATTWVVGTVVVGLLLVAAGWFFAISPRLSQAVVTQDQVTDVQSQNELLQAKIVSLKKQNDQIATYQAQLAGLRRQLPTSVASSDLLRQLQSEADAAGVTLVSVTNGTPTAFQSAAATTTDTSTSTTSGSASTASTSTATSTGSSTSSLVAIPLGVDVIGTYEAASAFLTAVQGTDDRLFLVTAAAITSQQRADASGGRPATKPGDAELQLTGYVLTLPETTTTTSGAAQPTPSLPAAVPGKNPLVPIG